MATLERDGFDSTWSSFVEDLRAIIDSTWESSASWPAWEKADGSRVTSLDLRLDASIRTCLALHFPDAAVLSEETGMLKPVGREPAQLSIVDPVDGTESLIAGQDSWWVSVGLLESNSPLAGFIYQPSTHRLHDSRRPELQKAADLIVGMSPDRLTSASTKDLRARLARAGAKLVETPHAVEKIAAVLEGRASATVYLPSDKSPAWHSWDLAAGVALAQASRLSLATLDGDPLRVDGTRTTFTSPWLCAVDDAVWNMVRGALE
jgi:fructose-1,6-bisphosphatase/inositol monophosphatase family enzyme